MGAEQVYSESQYLTMASKVLGLRDTIPGPMAILILVLRGPNVPVIPNGDV